MKTRYADVGITSVAVGGMALGAGFITGAIDDAYEEITSALGLDIESVVELQNGRPLGEFLN